MAVTLDARTIKIVPSSDGKLYGSNPDGDAGVGTGWPILYPNCQGSDCISNSGVIWEEAVYQAELALNDLAYQQAFYPTSSTLETKYSQVSEVKALNPVSGMMKVIQYTAPLWARSTTQPSSEREYWWSIITANSAEDEWLAHDTAGVKLLNQNQVSSGTYYVNMADHLLTTVGGKSYYEAAIDDLAARWDGSAYSGSVYLDVIDGMYWDSMDLRDSRPRYIKETDGTTVSYPDYARDGSGQVISSYLTGILRWQTLTRAAMPTIAVAGNGGSDGLNYSTDSGATDNGNIDEHAWYQSFDTRYSEWASDAFGLSPEYNPERGTFDSSTGDPTKYYVGYWRPERFYLDQEISKQLCRPDGTNKLGRRYVTVDVGLAYRGSTPYFQNCIADDFAYMRFYWALCMLHPGLMFTLNHGKSHPAPRLDESFVKLGNPVGSWSIGSLGTGGIGVLGREFNLRTADQASTSGSYGIFWQEFDHALVVVNMNSPTVDARWPQATTDTVTLPSAGSGKKWQRLNAATYTNPDYPVLACRSQDTAVNDGSDAGATITLRRGHALLLRRVDS